MATTTVAAGEIYFESRGTGDVLVLLHGFGCSVRCFDDVVSRLGDRQVVAIDLPGFGGSSAAGRGCSVPDLAATVVEVLDGLGIDRFAILGYSLGGAVAMRVAMDRPDRVTALIGVATQPAQGAARRPDNEALIERFAVSYGDREALAAGASQLSMYDVAAWNAQMVDDMLLTAEETWLDWLRNNVFWSQEDDLAGLSAPACFIVPGADVVIAPDDQLRTARQVRGARTVILEGYGHLLPGENPALLAHEITSHLAWVAAAPRA